VSDVLPFLLIAHASVAELYILTYHHTRYLAAHLQDMPSSFAIFPKYASLEYPAQRISDTVYNTAMESLVFKMIQLDSERVCRSIGAKSFSFDATYAFANKAGIRLSRSQGQAQEDISPFKGGLVTAVNEDTCILSWVSVGNYPLEHTAYPALVDALHVWFAGPMDTLARGPKEALRNARKRP